MRNRKNILNSLVHLKGELSAIQNELSNFPWDTEEAVLMISKIDLINVLKKCLHQQISFETLVNWANAIECRDDLDFENDEMQEVIFELANPEINGKISKDRLREIVERLNTNKS